MSKFIDCKNLISLAGLMMLGSLLIFCPKPTFANPSKSLNDKFISKQFAIYHKWCNSPWTGNDQPYQLLRTSIEKEASDGKKAVALMTIYQVQLAKRPKDPKNIFAYYYVAYRAGYQFGEFNQTQVTQIGWDIFNAVVNNDLPQTYNFERLVFLIGSPDGELKNVGERLLKRNPNDQLVEFNLILTFSQILNLADREYAIRMAENFQKRYPNMALGYYALGYAYQLKYAYELILLKNNDLIDANNAIANYQKFLNLSPPMANLIENANISIEWLKEKIVKQ